MDRIYLDPKKGVDPMLSYCYLCQKPKNEIFLTGIKGSRIRKEAGVHEDARGVCFDKVPCDECKSIMEQGVILISVRDNEPQSDNPYRTGGWCAVKPEAAKRMFDNIDFDKNRVCFIEDKAWDLIGLPRNQEIDNRKKDVTNESLEESCGDK